MSYMLRKRILTQSDLTDDTTWKIDLPDGGMITAFEVAIEATRKTDRVGAVACYPLVEMISGLEIIAESTKKIFSVSGRQADFINYLDFKRITERKHREQDAQYNNLSLFILGGRGLYDREYGFDMAKLKNAFLNYTYDLHEGDAYYFTDDSHDVNVYAWQWMGAGAPSFKGFFRTRQVLAYQTTGAGVINTLPITPGLPIRRIIVQAKDVDESLGGTWTRLELEINNGEYSPVVITSLANWVKSQVADYNLLNESHGHLWLASGGTRYYIPNEWAYFADGQATMYGIGAAAGDVSVEGFTKPIRVRAANNSALVNYAIRGFGYQGCLNIGLDHLPDEAEALITRGLGSVKLLMTETESGNKGAVVLQEIELY